MSKLGWFWCLLLSIGGMSIMVGVVRGLIIADTLTRVSASVGMLLFMIGYFLFVGGLIYSEFGEKDAR